MHVKGFLHRLLGPVIHKSRVKALSEVIMAAVCTKELRLTILGRAIDSDIQERSGIQKVNRLLGNRHLLAEQKVISQAVATLLIGNKKHPIIIVDWTKYPNSEDAVIRASLATEGRALTVYEERHPEKKTGNRKIQKNFLFALSTVLPKNCRAVIVTDAGFHNYWFRDILELGWDYVGRIRNIKKYCLEGKKTFHPCKWLFKRATDKVKHIGKVILTKGNPLETNFYLVKSKLRGRKALTKQGTVKRGKNSKIYARSHREPWLLASSLKGANAAKKVKIIYSMRMTIEEAFRDMKSNKYGLGLEMGKTKRKRRRDILLLIAMLATLIAWVTGKAGEMMNLQYRFQSSSIKHRRVISLFYLGCQLVRKRTRIALSLIWEVTASLKKETVYA